MSATADRLTGALADRYRLEGELGQGGPERTRGGGMATVHPSDDLRHTRRVALRVLNLSRTSGSVPPHASVSPSTTASRSPQPAP